jgi:hypothetical protein
MTILRIQSMDERTQSRKRKNDSHGDASHTLDERTKKQLKISIAQQVDYDKQIWCMSKISHDYTDFFGFVPPSLIGGIQCTTCGKKGHHFEVCLKRYTYCTHCEHYDHNSRNRLMKKFTLLELGNWLFRRQVKDDTLSQAMSHCSIDGSPTDLELKKACQPDGQISGSSWWRNQYMNPCNSLVFVSAMRKSSNALVTFSDQICFEYDEKGHYVNKSPQRRLKDQATETSIATLQTIQCSNNYKSQVIGNQNVLRSQSTQNATQTAPDRKYYNCEEKCHYFNGCQIPCIHHPSVLITNIAPTSSEKTAKVCFHCGQRCHCALQCPYRYQW